MGSTPTNILCFCLQIIPFFLKRQTLGFRDFLFLIKNVVALHTVLCYNNCNKR